MSNPNAMQPNTDHTETQKIDSVQTEPQTAQFHVDDAATVNMQSTQTPFVHEQPQFTQQSAQANPQQAFASAPMNAAPAAAATSAAVTSDSATKLWNKKAWFFAAVAGVALLGGLVGGLGGGALYSAASTPSADHGSRGGFSMGMEDEDFQGMNDMNEEDFMQGRGRGPQSMDSDSNSRPDRDMRTPFGQSEGSEGEGDSSQDPQTDQNKSDTDSKQQQSDTDTQQSNTSDLDELFLLSAQ